MRQVPTVLIKYGISNGRSVFLSGKERAHPKAGCCDFYWM